MVKIAALLALIGVPEMTPVEPLSDKPGGNPGLTTNPSIDPDTAGVNAMASPTTAGKGCDPLYDNAGGGGRVAGSRPPQAQSQDRPMNTPTRRIGITTQFARQPTVENVTTESSVVKCPSNVAPEAVFE
jgi:hypothetical protein